MRWCMEKIKVTLMYDTDNTNYLFFSSSGRTNVDFAKNDNTYIGELEVPREQYEEWMEIERDYFMIQQEMKKLLIAR